MEITAYPFSVDASGLVYTFVSKGIRLLTKKVLFTAINPFFYNVELRTEEDDVLLPDTENSNNGDAFQVLWTCAGIVRHFMERNTDKAVYIRGSEGRRQRRYQRMLAEAIKKDESLSVYGELPDGELEPFQEGIAYVACLVFTA